MAVSGTPSVNNIANGMNSAAQAAETSSAQEMSDRFMTLLVAQMKHQDPLNPLDNAQLTSQMAQISTVTGIEQLNTTMNWLGYSMASLQATQAAGLIGRDMLAPGDVLRLTDDVREVKGGYYVPQPIESASLIVRNEAGVEVFRKDLKGDELKEGTQAFTWDGKNNNGDPVASGTYSFQVLMKAGDTEAAANTLSVSSIQSVQPDPGGTMVTDQYGNSIRLIDVMQIM